MISSHSFRVLHAVAVRSIAWNAHVALRIVGIGIPRAEGSRPKSIGGASAIRTHAAVSTGARVIPIVTACRKYPEALGNQEDLPWSQFIAVDEDASMRRGDVSRSKSE